MTPLFACLVATGPAATAAGEGAAVRTPCSGGGPSPAVQLDLGSRLVDAAREFSPRIERPADGAVVCDVAGLERLFGDARTIAAELRREAADRHVLARVAVASTRAAAAIAAHARPGLTVVEPGTEAATLAALPVSALDAVRGCTALVPGVTAPAPPARFYRTSPMEDLARERSRAARRGRSSRAAAALATHEALMATLARWGVRTLGDLATLPAADLSARLGQAGVTLQRLARGEDTGPLVPLVPDERFEAHLDLEWPIEGLEPLSFVLGRLLDPVCAHLERRGRAGSAMTTTLRLVSRAVHARTLQLPAPMRDPRALRTLALLDLESHPPGAGIDAVTVTIEPTPGRVLQFSLLERALPAPEQLSTLVARLSALMGQDRCGSPHVPDTHRPGAFTLVPFAVDQRERTRPPMGRPADGSARASGDEHAPGTAPPALRRFRHPVPIRVTVEAGRPAQVAADRAGIPAGRVQMGAGPWRTSGDWWVDGDQAPIAEAVTVPVDRGAARPGADAVTAAADAWNRDEWDVALEDGSLCRIFHDRGGRGWFIDAVID